MTDAVNLTGILSKQPAKALMDACKHEISRLELELKQARSRVVQSLAESLLPESWLAPSPGIMIVQLPGKIRVDESSDLDLRTSDGTLFTPSWKEVPLVDAEVVEHKIAERERTLTLGIHVKDLAELFGKTVCFEIAGTPESSSEFYRLLPFTLWSCQGKTLRTFVSPGGRLKDSAIPMGANIMHLYDNRFVDIVGFTDSPIQEGESADDIPARRFEDLTWIEIRFPLTVSPDTLNGIRCHLNCVPVVNVERHSMVRSLEADYQTFELDDHEGYFVGVDEVVFDPDKRREVVPFDQYTVRRKGVRQFSDLDGKEKIVDALQSLKSEYQAYKGVREEYEKDLLELLERTSDLQKRVASRVTNRFDAQIFLQFHEAKAAGEIEINYFSTDGLMESVPRKGDSLKCRGGSARVMSECYFMPNDDPAIRIAQLRHAIVSRGHIVTKADVLSACNMFLSGNTQAKRLEIRKGATLSPKPNEGIVDCIHVVIDPKSVTSIPVELWEASARHLEMYLNENSVIGVNFNVVVRYAEG